MHAESTELQPCALPGRVQARLVEIVGGAAWDLPLLPEAAGQVIAATRDDRCDAKRLADVVRRDAALTGHLLRIANSPLYASPVRLVSLQQAVARLGMKSIREIALVVSCQTEVFRVAGYEAQVRGLFRHSLAAGVIAQEIARLRRWSVEESFLSGLLHDVGRPVLLQVLVDLHREAMLPMDPAAVEAAMLEHHEAIGGTLARRWGLTERLQLTVLHHHEPEPPQACAQSVFVVQLADDLAHFLLGDSPVVEAAIRQHPALERLNLYPEDLDALLARRAEVLAAAQAIG